MSKRIAPREYKGSITIFSALLFILICMVLIAQFQSAIYYSQHADAERAANFSCDGFLAGYCRPLREDYGILAVDGGFGQHHFQMAAVQEVLLLAFEKNYRRGSSIEEPICTMLLDDDWELFLRELHLACPEDDDRPEVQSVLEAYRQGERAVLADFEARQSEAGHENTEGEENQSETPADNEIRDPRDFLNKIWKQGILAAACPSGYRISNRELRVLELPFTVEKDELPLAMDFKDEKAVGEFLKGWKAGKEPVVKEAEVPIYIQKVFQNASEGSKNPSGRNRSLQYEVEYILAGHGTDRENLEAILWKLLIFRTVLNMEHILASPDKKLQTQETALVLSSAMAMPWLSKVLDGLLQFTWAFAEGLADCRCLLKGGRIPIFKDSASWHLSWEAMLSLSEAVLDGAEGVKGLSYNEYLFVLLEMMDLKTQCMRMANLIEQNIQLVPGYENFHMHNCIYGIQTRFQCKSSIGHEFQVQAAGAY